MYVGLTHHRCGADMSLDAEFSVLVLKLVLIGMFEKFSSYNFPYIIRITNRHGDLIFRNVASYFNGRICEPIEKNNPACCPAACPLNCPKQPTCSYSALDSQYKCSCLGVNFVDPTRPDEEKFDISQF